MNAKFFESIIPNVNNVYFSPSFMMKGNKLKYVTNTGEIISSDASLRLYRIMRVSNILEVIKQKELRFDFPSRWQDPFEKLFYQRVVNCGGNDYYVACFCFSCDSVEGEESLWNIHAKLSSPIKGVTPYTTNYDVCPVRACFDMLSLCKNLANANPGLKFYLAPVDYSKSRKDILKVKRERRGGYKSLNEFIGDMLLKRKAFSYEKEIRLFVVSEQPFHEDKNAPGFTLLKLNNKRSGIITSLTLPPIPVENPYNANTYHNDLESKANPVKSYLITNGYKKTIYISRLYDMNV